MTVQDLMQQFSEISGKTLTLQELLMHPATWVVAYVVFALTIGLSKTKSYAQTFTDPVETPDYIGAVLLFLTSPIWVPLGIPCMLLGGLVCGVGKHIIGR